MPDLSYTLMHCLREMLRSLSLSEEYVAHSFWQFVR